MAKQTIGIGTVANDGTGDPIRDAFDKCNDNFTELYNADAALGTAAALNVDTDGTLAANSDAKIATQKAVKTAIAAAIAGLIELAGNTDCSANPNYPAASKGDAYYVTVAGKIGGASGKSVDIGDLYIAKADNAGGTEASVGTSWFVLEHNLAAMLPLTGGTLSGALSVPDDVYDATGWNGSVEVPTKNAVRDKIEAVVAGAGSVSDTVYGAGWNGDTTVAPSKNAVYDKIEAIVAGIPGSYTDEQAQDAVGTILTDTATIDFTYNDGAPSITADVKTGSIGSTQLADTAVTPGSYTNTNLTVDADGRITAASNGSGGSSGLTRGQAAQIAFGTFFG